MTDFEAAVSSRVQLWHKGRIVLPPSHSRANLGDFHGVRGMVLFLARGRFGGMILMQEKGLMPPRAA